MKYLLLRYSFLTTLLLINLVGLQAQKNKDGFKKYLMASQ